MDRNTQIREKEVISNNHFTNISIEKEKLKNYFYKERQQITIYFQGAIAMNIEVINFAEKIDKIKELHSYKVIAQMNNYYFKLVSAR